MGLGNVHPMGGEGDESEVARSGLGCVAGFGGAGLARAEL
jgi:hypothetical protein